MNGLDQNAFNRTPQNVVDKIYKIMACVDACLTENGIPYSLIGGSLLGAIRHDGLIPWDDDGDIGIHINYRDRAIQALESLDGRDGLGVHKELISYKVYPIDGRKVGPLEAALYPFVDIFFFSDFGDGALRFTEEKAREFFPTQFFLLDEWKNFARRDFGPLSLSCVRAEYATRYLTDAYGPDWPSRAYLTWNHIQWKRNEKVRVELTDTSPALPTPEMAELISNFHAKST